MKTKVCKKCGHVFDVPNNRSAHRLYCNNCLTKVCKYCGKEFKVRGINLGVFCSTTCNSLWKKDNGVRPPSRKGTHFVNPLKGKRLKEPMYYSCDYCGKYFVIKPHRIKRSKTLCCSKKCYHKLMDKGITTYWERLKKTTEYSTWRTQVFERDDYTCVICGKIGGKLQAHHIKPKSLYPELVFDTSNGQTLCAPCHHKTETYGGKVNYYESKK